MINEDLRTRQFVFPFLDGAALHLPDSAPVVLHEEAIVAVELSVGVYSPQKGAVLVILLPTPADAAFHGHVVVIAPRALVMRLAGVNSTPENRLL